MSLNSSQHIIKDYFGIKNCVSYDSNIGYILVPKNSEKVYKVFLHQGDYDHEREFYDIFANENILIPRYFSHGKIGDMYVLELENIRRDFKRKEWLTMLPIEKIASALKNIHAIDTHKYFGTGGNIILCDVHVSNFFEKKGIASLGIFDFSSAKLGQKEQDIACVYIEIGLDDEKMAEFIRVYGDKIDMTLVYRYSIHKLQQVIQEGMNLGRDAKMKYYKYLLVLKNKLKL